MIRKFVIAASLALLPAGAALAESHSSGEMEISGDAAAGESVFRKCQACHAVGENARNKVGPALNGVVGSDVASVEGYNYSNGMTSWGEGKQWTPDVLATYLENPRGTVSGTKMAFPGLRKEDERANVIAYLATFNEDGTTAEGGS